MPRKTNAPRDNFACGHHGGNICKYTAEPCTGTSCRSYGQCGECRFYYIPAGQSPCKGCQYLNIRRRI